MKESDLKRTDKNRVSESQRKLDTVAAMIMSAQLSGRFGNTKLKDFSNKNDLIVFDIGKTKFSIEDAGGAEVAILLETKDEVMHIPSSYPEDVLMWIDCVISGMV